MLICSYCDQPLTPHYMLLDGIYGCKRPDCEWWLQGDDRPRKQYILWLRGFGEIPHPFELFLRDDIDIYGLLRLMHPVADQCEKLSAKLTILKRKLAALDGTDCKIKILQSQQRRMESVARSQRRATKLYQIYGLPPDSFKHDAMMARMMRIFLSLKLNSVEI